METAGVATLKQKNSTLNTSTSLNAPVKEDSDNETELEVFIEDEAALQAFYAVEDKIAHEQLCAVLYPLLNTVSPEGQEVIFAHYWLGLTFEEIGKQYGISRQRVHQIETKALNQLRCNPAVKQLQEYLDNN